MHTGQDIFKKEKSGISVTALKRLLIELRDKRSDIGFRYRLIGELWVSNFLKIVQVSENGALFNEVSKNAFTVLGDLSMIMQFEIDHGFQDFQPYFHYEVSTVIE